jgi:arginase family enzyme
VRARQLLDGASFGPDALRAVSEAFDAAWSEIADHFGNDPADIENARYKLATALLSIASEESRDVDVLKKAALLKLALDYQRRRPTAS